MPRVMIRSKTRAAKPFLLMLCAISLALISVPRLLTGSGTDPHFAQLLQQGREAEAAGRMDDAIARYQEALKISPGSPLPQALLAALYFARKDYEQTLTYGDRVLAVNPRDAATAGLAGKAAYQLNRYQPAVSICNPPWPSRAATLNFIIGWE